jgi:hypothetical protein
MRPNQIQAAHIFKLVIPSLTAIGMDPKDYQLLSGSYSSFVLRIIFRSAPALILKMPSTNEKATTESTVLSALGYLPFIPSIVATLECGDRRAILMREHPGKALGGRTCGDLPFCRSLGVALATLHLEGFDLLNANKVTIGPNWLPPLMQLATAERILICRKIDCLDWSAVAGIYDELIQTVPPNPTPCLTHADFRLGNILVADGNLSAILDFESAHIGSANIDLLRIADDLGGLNSDEMASLLAGYGSIGEPPIDLFDTEYLYRLHLSIACISWCIKNVSFNTIFFKHHLSFVDHFIQRH